MIVDKGLISGLADVQTSTFVEELQPGDRILVERGMVLDSGEEVTRTTGIVLRTEHACHPCRSGYRVGDLILMELSDGDLIVITIGESTVVRRA